MHTSCYCILDFSSVQSDLLRSFHLYISKIIEKTLNNPSRLIRRGLMSFQLVLFPVKLNTIHSLNLLHSILLLGLLVHAPAHIHAYENFTPMPPFGSVTSYYLLIILVTWLISARQSNSGHLNCLNIYINISSNIV